MLRRATHENVPQLAHTNWQLIRDEGSDNPMTVAQLAERMTGSLTTTYYAWMIQPAQLVVGYILVDMGRRLCYLRYMYVVAAGRICCVV